MNHDQKYNIADTWTQIPNIFLDELLPNLKPAECLVLMYVCRHTFGFHRSIKICTIDEISEAMKLSRTAVKDALRVFIAKGIIVRTARFAAGKKKWNLANGYEIKTAGTAYWREPGEDDLESGESEPEPIELGGHGRDPHRIPREVAGATEGGRGNDPHFLKKVIKEISTTGPTENHTQTSDLTPNSVSPIETDALLPQSGSQSSLPDLQPNEQDPAPRKEKEPADMSEHISDETTSVVDWSDVVLIYRQKAKPKQGPRKKFAAVIDGLRDGGHDAGSVMRALEEFLSIPYEAEREFSPQRFAIFFWSTGQRPSGRRAAVAPTPPPKPTQSPLAPKAPQEQAPDFLPLPEEIRIWNTFAPESHRVHVWRKSSQATLDAQKQFPQFSEHWETICRRAAASIPTAGGTGKWTVSLDWLLKDHDHWGKVLEGRYPFTTAPITSHREKLAAPTPPRRYDWRYMQPPLDEFAGYTWCRIFVTQDADEEVSDETKCVMMQIWNERLTQNSKSIMRESEHFRREKLAVPYDPTGADPHRSMLVLTANGIELRDQAFVADPDLRKTKRGGSK